MKLGLGTVQFGVSYGVSNTTGQPSADEVARILELARMEGMTVLDTAPSYGTSESVLGQLLPAHHSFHIVTKTPPLGKKTIQKSDVSLVRNTFHQSLEKLRQKSLYGLLVHHADDLLQPGGDLLLEAMQSLKAEKGVQKLGVSVYTSEQIDRVLKLFQPDIIQLPINVFDQRLIRSGHIDRLKSKGIEIHARSVFLQGLLLMDPVRIDSFFSPIQEHIKSYRNYLTAKGLTPIQAALRFAVQLDGLDTVLVGVCSASELQEIVSAYHSHEALKIDMSQFSVMNEDMVTPSLWKLAV